MDDLREELHELAGELRQSRDELRVEMAFEYPGEDGSPCLGSYNGVVDREWFFANLTGSDVFDFLRQTISIFLSFISMKKLCIK